MISEINWMPNGLCCFPDVYLPRMDQVPCELQELAQPLPKFPDGLYGSYKFKASVERAVAKVFCERFRVENVPPGLTIIADRYFPDNRACLIADGKIVRWFDVEYDK